MFRFKTNMPTYKGHTKEKESYLILGVLVLKNEYF